jgi:thiol-disulfide isomerase/thioredoxin
MKKAILFLIAAIVVVLAFSAVASAAGMPPPVGGQLPDIKLAMPKDSGDKSYLGFSFGFGSFKIPQIKAKVVIIEIFSMYCPYCQKEAPVVNQLYDRIEQNAALKGKIKLIGIGAGNSLYEVGIFKTRYNVPFPLFADGDYLIHKQVGEVRTPYFVGVKINADGTHQVIYSKLGAFESVDQFLSTIIKLSGLQ